MNEIMNLNSADINVVYRWGIDLIKTVQTISNPFLDSIIIMLSDGLVYGFVFVPLLYIWCIDYKKGLNLFYLFSFGAGLNEGLKLLFHVPRPYTHAPEILKARVTRFSTPSGHSVTGAMMYPTVFFYEKKFSLIKLILAFLFPIFIGFTRIYLGVHYPTDVLSGFILGTIIFFIFILFAFDIEKKIIVLSEKHAEKTGKNIKSVRFAAAAVFAFIVTVICNERVMYGGFLLGLAFGNIYIKETYCPSFDAGSGSIFQKIMRFVLGSVIILLPLFIFFKLGIKKNYEQYKLFLFLTFFITASLISGLLPLTFTRLKFCGEKNADR